MTKDELIRLKEDIVNLSDKELGEYDTLDTIESQGQIVRDGESKQKYYDEEIEKAIFNDTSKNAFLYIKDSTIQYGEYTALSYAKNNIKYKDFIKEAYKYANVLKKYGLQKGDTISLLLPNVPEIVYYYYGAWILGVKVNPIDPRFNSDGILLSVNNSNSKLLVSILDCYNSKITPIKDKIRAENIIIVSPSDSMKYTPKEIIGKCLYKYKEFLLNLSDKDFSSGKIILNTDFLKHADSSLIDAVYEDGLIASNLFTSGTTGTPKAAQLSHQAYNIKSNQIKYGVPNLDPKDKFLAIIPFFSGYGSFAGMHNCLNKGMNLIMIPKFDPNNVSDLIYKYKPSAMIGVPKYWEDFANDYELNTKKHKPMNLDFLKIPVAGGDEISSKVVDKFNELFFKQGLSTKLVIGYGSTEMGGPVATTVSNPMCWDNNYTGVLFPGVKCVFINPETKEVLANGKYGELAINDPGMMKGYENDVDTNAITIYHNGERYFMTGDLFEMNEKGMLYFKGRVKRAMMRPDGHTVHSLPIEIAINSCDEVKDCCVVGLKRKDGSSGTIPTAFIVLNDGYEINEELINHIDKISLQKLSERNRALAYVFIRKLPYSLMGKIDYKLLEKNFVDDLNCYFVDDTFVKDNISKQHVLVKK